MATVIDLADRRMGGAVRKPLHGESAKILLFTGVRFERLDGSQPRDGNPDEHRGNDKTLRNRAS
jgi:hypothetical protein